MYMTKGESYVAHRIIVLNYFLVESIEMRLVSLCVCVALACRRPVYVQRTYRW